VAEGVLGREKGCGGRRKQAGHQPPPRHTCCRPANARATEMKMSSTASCHQATRSIRPHSSSRTRQERRSRHAPPTTPGAGTQTVHRRYTQRWYRNRTARATTVPHKNVEGEGEGHKEVVTRSRDKEAGAEAPREDMEEMVDGITHAYQWYVVPCAGSSALSEIQYFCRRYVMRCFQTNVRACRRGFI